MVLPLLALTWMSAVLAMTDKRSILFQILFAVFDSLQGFVIVMVHCILRREVRSRTGPGGGRWGDPRDHDSFLVVNTPVQTLVMTVGFLFFPLQVQDAFRCRLRNCQDPISGDATGTFPNGHAQIMVGLFSLFKSLFHEPI